MRYIISLSSFDLNQCDFFFFSEFKTPHERKENSMRRPKQFNLLAYKEKISKVIWTIRIFSYHSCFAIIKKKMYIYRIFSVWKFKQPNKIFKYLNSIKNWHFRQLKNDFFEINLNNYLITYSKMTFEVEI